MEILKYIHKDLIMQVWELENNNLFYSIKDGRENSINKPQMDMWYTQKRESIQNYHMQSFTLNNMMNLEIFKHGLQIIIV